MSRTIAIANGQNEVERAAAQDANEVQDACNQLQRGESAEFEVIPL